MNEFEKCVLCDSSDIYKLDDFSAAYLSKCNACGMVFCYRKPSLSELQKHYDSYMRIETVSLATAKRYDELLDGFEVYRKTNNLIDVGCGNGHFLAAAKKRSWNVYGTEYADEAIKFCEQKGIHMKKGELNVSDYTSEMFDILLSIEVIEHINYPHRELDSFKSIIRKGGLLYMTTPNFNSLSRRILKSKWNIIEYPEHLCYYTAATLSKVLDEHGFSKRKLITTGISPSRFRQAQSTKQWEFGQDVDNAIAESVEQKQYLQFLKSVINSMLNFSKSGDTIKAWFVKS